MAVAMSQRANMMGVLYHLMYKLDGLSVYEVPPEKYPAEQIIKIIVITCSQN